MLHRWIVAVVAASALLLAGCGGGKVTTPSTSTAASSSAKPSSQESTPATAPSATPEPQAGALDPRACTDVTGANLDLTVATTAEDAQKAADVFAKYQPPPDVQEAIDHFVSTNGAHFDDPDFEKYNSRINGWVEAVCPV